MRVKRNCHREQTKINLQGSLTHVTLIHIHYIVVTGLHIMLSRVKELYMICNKISLRFNYFYTLILVFDNFLHKLTRPLKKYFSWSSYVMITL